MIEVFILLLAASSGQASTAADPARIDPEAAAAIERANEEWLPAVKSGDAAGLAAPYAEDAEFVLSDGTMVTGRSAIQAMYARRATSTARPLSGAITSCGKLVSATDEILEWGYGRLSSRVADGTVKESGGPFVTWWQKLPSGQWRIKRNAIFQAAEAKDADPCLDAVSHAFDDAQFRKAQGAIAAFLSPELVYVRGTGEKADRARFEQTFTDPKTIFAPFVIRDRHIIMLGRDSAIVAADGVIKGKSGEESFADHFRYADVFRRQDGRWQVVYVQVTPLPAIHEP